MAKADVAISMYYMSPCLLFAVQANMLKKTSNFRLAIYIMAKVPQEKKLKQREAAVTSEA